jgi:hypothetical protein
MKQSMNGQAAQLVFPVPYLEETTQTTKPPDMLLKFQLTTCGLICLSTYFCQNTGSYLFL